jgi:hypothetical protein
LVSWLAIIKFVEDLTIVGWNSIDLMDHPSNMEIGLCWFQKGINNTWTYNLTDHLMIYLETIIALASMAFIVDLVAYQ